MSETAFNTGNVHLHRTEISGYEQLVSPWTRVKSHDSLPLLNKLWGYQAQLRVTLLPQEIKIEEVARPNLSGTWQNLYAKFAAIIGKKVEFDASVVNSLVMPSKLTEEQRDYLKTILEKEELPLMAIDAMSFSQVAQQLKTAVDQVAEAHLNMSIAFLKSMDLSLLQSDEKQWLNFKSTVNQLAEHYFTKMCGSFLSQYASSILETIQDALDDPKLRQNPSVFMAEWIEERGATEEFRIPEDPAREFLRRIF